MKLTKEELRAAKFYAGADWCPHCEADNLTEEEIAAAKLLAYHRAEYRISRGSYLTALEPDQKPLPESWEVLDAVAAFTHWLGSDRPAFVDIILDAALEFAKCNESEYPEDRNLYEEYRAQAIAHEKLVMGGL